MYAVIQTGGKQYRVSLGDLLRVEKLSGEAGDQITFDNVLLVGGDDEHRVGQPVVSGASVIATIVGQTRGDKIVVFKFKRRKMYRRKTGHRQYLTAVRIEEIKTARAPKKEARSKEVPDVVSQAEALPKKKAPSKKALDAGTQKEAAPKKKAPSKKASDADSQKEVVPEGDPVTENEE